VVAGADPWAMGICSPWLATWALGAVVSIGADEVGGAEAEVVGNGDGGSDGGPDGGLDWGADGDRSALMVAVSFSRRGLTRAGLC